MGFLAVWDSRNNVASPSTGAYYRFDVSTSRGFFGSDYSYDRIRFDARRFYPVYRAHVIALRSYAAVTPGRVPFTQLPLLGGSNLMRGYYTGRYRDQALVAAQMEYRMPVWWRFGVVACGSVGEVAPSIDALAFDRFRFAGGAGLRFAVVPSEKINIRIDLAASSSSSGLYMALGEAF